MSLNYHLAEDTHIIFVYFLIFIFPIELNMTKLASFLFLLFIVGGKSAKQENAVLNCLVDQDSLGCVKNLTDATLDAIELKVTGTKDNVTFSKVMERTSGFIVHEISNLFDDNTSKYSSWFLLIC